LTHITSIKEFHYNLKHRIVIEHITWAYYHLW